MTYINKCPNCKRANEPISYWERVNKLNFEYKCACGCHWVSRFGFYCRDILDFGDETQKAGEHLD